MLWVSYCTRKGGYRFRLIERARRQRIRIFVSEYILRETIQTLIEDLGQTPRFAGLARRAILGIAKVVKLPLISKVAINEDPDDEPIVQTALSSKADYLVTADKVILKLRKVQDVEVLSPVQFERLLDPDR
ncbi:MAG: putative toxin-antitoxin system toxin component, PIN family [Gemmataceae bacterium]